MTAAGYRRVNAPGHAIADSSGKSYAHRVALYDAIGPGPHTCHWCKWPGLEWGLPRKDPNCLIVDHLNGVGDDNRPENLVAAHDWCNNNRYVIERRHIPWSTWKDIAPTERKALYNPGTKRDTRYAEELSQQSPQPMVEPPPPLAEKPELLPIRKGFVRWEALLG